MTDRPYTDEDLRAEAASCLTALVTLPATADIRRSLPDTYIDSHFTPDSGADATWAAVVGEDGLDVPVREIHALIQGAANTAEWAINLGADGLEPTAHVINLDNPDGPFVRLHLAIHPDMPETDRPRLHAGLKWVITDAIGQLAPVEDTLPAWLYQRFNESLAAPAWDRLTEADRTYWEHHAAAVRRAVARGGFKAAEGAQR